MFTRWIRLCLVLAILLAPFAGLLTAAPVAAAPPPPPTLSTTAAEDSGKLAPSAPNCALLDDPATRGLLSGALETALLHACGRAPAPNAAKTPPAPMAPLALGDDALVNDPAGEHTSLTQNGAVVAYNADTGGLCAAYVDSYHGVVEGTGYTGFSSSTDGGVTWVDHGSLNDANSLGDPALVWRRADGHFYLATLHANGLGLWTLGAACDAATWVGMIHTGASDDKEMLAVDNNPASPYAGWFYVAWTDYTNGHIYASRSDNGQIWGAPVDVSGHNQVNGAWPAVDPTTGDVYVAWTHWDVYPDGPIDVEMARSTDGGATWASIANPMSDEVAPRDATATANCGRPALNGDIRYFPYPQIAVGPNGVLHAVYSYDPDGYDSGDVVNIYYRRSTDQGATWETERQINNNWTWTDQFSPALAVGETGEIGVFWYDRGLDSANNLLYDRYMALSRDSGVSFEANQRVSDASSPVVAAAGLATCYHGDRDGAAAGGGSFYTVWGDDRRGDADVWADSEPYVWDRLFGTAYDANTLRGLPAALVETAHPPTGLPFTAAGDAVGYYERRVPGDATYAVTAWVYGYAPHTVTTTVTADDGQADIPLTPVAFWDVSGQVTDATTGYPVYAHLSVTGEPLDPPAPANEAWSDGFTGAYSLTLAGALPYTLTVAAEGYLSQTYSLGALNAPLFNINVALQPDLAACSAPGYELTPPCQPALGAVLQPTQTTTAGCPCEPQPHTLYFANHTSAADEILLSYAASPGVSVALPATLGVVPDTGVQPFVVTLTLDRGVCYSATVVVSVTASLASNPAISDTAVITKRALEPTEWAARADSPSPSMDGAVIEYGGKVYNVGGYGSGGAVDIYDPAADAWTTGASEPAPIIDFPVDACFGYAAPDDPVILLLPDAQGVITGTWHRYHIASNTWDTPVLPATLPVSGIWASDIVVDYRANQCYITGGATTAGGGNLTTLYRYDPAANTAALLGNFTHIPGGFDFHAGWYVPWIGTAGGVCVGGGINISSTVYADTQCYDIAAATFNPPNADLGPLPEPWWGMADMEKVASDGRQLWLANGVATSGNSRQRSAYFAQALGQFVYGPDPLYGIYRVEGAAVQDKVYVMDGSVGSFSPGTLNEQLLQCPACADGVSLAKTASTDWVYPGEIVTYTVVVAAPNWLTGTATLVDALPTGATFTGYVSATYGAAWYSATDNALYWTRPAAPLVNRPASALPLPLPSVAAPASPLGAGATLSDLPRPRVPLAPAAVGDVLETFTNTWATNELGLVYNPETGSLRYAHEGNFGVFDVAYPIPHPMLSHFKLSDVNPGWPTALDNRDGIGYDYTTGHYFLPDYEGDLSNHDDHIVEIDTAGHILHAWETDGLDNDSYDGSAIQQILDIAVVPGAPPRYFATALGDGALVYEIDLRQAGQFTPNTWGTVITCTVPGIADTSGIDYDAQNGVLYHSDWNSANIVVTDLHCNVVDAFVCDNGVSSINTGVTFVEGQWPPEVWVTDYASHRTTRCEAIGHAAPPPVITITYSVIADAPVSTTVVNTATLDYRGLSLSPAIPSHTHYVAGTWNDDTVYLLDANLRVLGSFPAGKLNPNGMTANRTTIWSGHYNPPGVVAYDFNGHELYRWSAAISGLQGMELVNDTLAIYQSNTIEFRDPRTGALHRTIPAKSSIEGLAFDGALLWQLDNDWIYGADPADGTVVITLTNAASGCSYGGSGITADDTGALTLACVNGDWFRVSPIDGSIIVTGNNGLNMYGLAYAPSQRVADDAAFHVAPRPAVTWTQEVYVNGVYVGRYDEGPFTAAPADDVQIVDQLDYVGHDPLFVHLAQDWAGQPLTLTAEFHSRGVIVDGDWYVTLLPDTSARLVKTFHLTDTTPATITATLLPDGLPDETRAVAFQPPVFAKAGPTTAYHGQIIAYTLTLDTINPLFGALYLTDTLPAGVEFAGNLRASYGQVSYNPGDATLYWNNLPALALTRPALAPTGAQPETGPSATTRSETDLSRESTPSKTGTNTSTTLPPSPPPPLSPSPHPLAPTASWYTAAPLPTGRIRYAHAQCPGEPNRFYIISGVTNGSYTDAVWRYDADTDVWTTLAPLPAAVEGPSAACYQGRIYVAGGNGAAQFYIYDIVHNTWTAGPGLPRNVWGAALGAWDGRLFLAGGDNDFALGNASAEVNIYDIAAGAWNALGATMPVSTATAGWTQVNEYLYVVGGWGDQSPTHNITATQRYNMAYNYWETGPVFSHTVAGGRADFVLAATEQYLYAIGGDASGGSAFNATPFVERLDYTNWYGDVWTDINDPLPAALTGYSGSFCTTAKSGGEIWSVGGLTAGWVYTTAAQYRPSEPCVSIPPTVTITFDARVTAGAGERVTNTATLNFRGAILTATTAFDVPLPDWEKTVNGQPWTPGLTVTVQTSDTLTVTDVITTGSAFSLHEEWQMAHLTLLNYEVTPPVGAVREQPWIEAPTAPFAYTRFDAAYADSTGHIYFLGGRLANGNTSGRIWEFDPATGVYTDTGVDMPTPVANYTIARLTDGAGDEVLVTFGGRLAGGGVTDIVQGFYPVGGLTVAFSADPYPVATSPGGVAVVNNNAYVFGGFTGTAVISDTYFFDITAPAGSRWTAGPPLNRARSYIGAAVVDGVIYALGGDDYVGNLIPLTITEKLDPAAGVLAWDDAGVADMPIACGETQAFGLDTDAPYPLAGSLILAGCGQWPGETAESLRYDVAANAWDVAFPDLNQARRNHAGAFIPAGAGAGRTGLWVWGGRQFTDGNLLSTPEYYDLDTGRLYWDAPAGLTAPVMLTKVFHVAPCTWTHTLLGEALHIGAWSEAREVIFEKLPPALHIGGANADAFPGQAVTLTVAYSNTGGYENAVRARVEFPATAPLLNADPAPAAFDPAGLWAEWALGDLAQGSGGSLAVSVAVTESLAPGATATLWAGIHDHVGALAGAGEITLTIRPPAAAWEKLIAVNGVFTATDPIAALPGDEVQIVDRVWITYTAPVSFTLTEAWTSELTMTALTADVAPATWTPQGPAVVQGLNVAPNTWYAITKTFTVGAGEWTLASVTETLEIASGGATERIVRLKNGEVCWPAAIASLSSDGPVTRGTALHFTAVVDGDAPFTYTWDFGGAGVGAGLAGPTPVFTYSAAGTYTVTLDAANACGADHAELSVDVLRPTYTLTLAVDGPGSITPPPGVATYLEGDLATITATANPGAHFLGWAGDLSGNDNPATVLMDGNKTITATFTTETVYTLTVKQAGAGNGALEPPAGTHGYVAGSAVVLTATADVGSAFAGWSGSVNSSDPSIVVIMNGDRAVTATFDLRSFDLTLATGGDGHGTTTPAPGVHPYDYGAVVWITATANSDSTFTGWAGDASGAANPISITINAAKAITAIFTLKPPTYHTLTVATSGTGSGGVEPPVGAHSYLSGTTVVLTATTHTGSTFAGWGGDASGSALTATVLMDGPKTVTATFALAEVCEEVTGVTLTRVTAGDLYTDTVVEFRADIFPTTAVPYTYMIDFGAGPSAPAVTVNNPLTLTHTFPTTGAHTVTFAAWNCAMTTSRTAGLTVSILGRTTAPPIIYLPLVVRNAGN